MEGKSATTHVGIVLSQKTECGGFEIRIAVSDKLRKSIGGW